MVDASQCLVLRQACLLSSFELKEPILELLADWVTLAVSSFIPAPPVLILKIVDKDVTFSQGTLAG